MKAKRKRRNKPVMIEDEDGEMINGCRIETYDYPYGTRPLYQVRMTSGKIHLVSEEELGKVFPEVLL